MDKASGSGDRPSIGEKTHISLRTACAICVIAIIPLTAFLKGVSDELSAIRTLMQASDVRTQDALKDHEDRLRKHESRISSLEASEAKKP